MFLGNLLVRGIAGGITSGSAYFGIKVGSSEPPGSGSALRPRNSPATNDTASPREATRKRFMGMLSFRRFVRRAFACLRRGRCRADAWKSRAQRRKRCVIGARGTALSFLHPPRDYDAYDVLAAVMESRTAWSAV